MTASRTVVLLGSGPILSIARSMLADAASTIEVPPERIADADIAALVGHTPSEADVFAAVGLHALNHARSDLAARIKRAGYALARVIHDKAVVASTARIGANVLIAGAASVGPDCEIGEGCVILDGARIEAGARIGAYAWIGANVAVGFGASVGAHSILRPGVHLDAGVPVGHHCELSTPGLRQAAIPDAVFETPTFASARVYAGRAG